MKIFNNKLFRALLIVMLIGFLCGIVGFFFINEDSKKAIISNINSYFSSLKVSNIKYGKYLFKSLFDNLKYTSLIWICGIIFILIFLIPFIIYFKAFIEGFTSILIITSYGLKGILYWLILIIPDVVYIFILIILSYYSVNYAIKLFNIYKNNKTINFKSFINKYFKIYLILNIVLLINSLFKVYICSIILKNIV